MDSQLTISELARKVGVSVKTLLRWEKTGKIRKAKRDWKGWRTYFQEDLIEIEKILHSFYEPEEIVFRERGRI